MAYAGRNKSTLTERTIVQDVRVSTVDKAELKKGNSLAFYKRFNRSSGPGSKGKSRSIESKETQLNYD
jgi:hypothetical protein